MLLLKAPSARFVWHDVFASVVVFLVALPLSMGIAIASGVPMEKAASVGLLTAIRILRFQQERISALNGSAPERPWASNVYSQHKRGGHHGLW